jgi:hypothetical protein
LVWPAVVATTQISNLNCRSAGIRLWRQLRLDEATGKPGHPEDYHYTRLFTCDIQRAITLAPEAPCAEGPGFGVRNVDLIPAALHTLRYVDCAPLARRITAGKEMSAPVHRSPVTCTAQVERRLRCLRDFLLGALGTMPLTAGWGAPARRESRRPARGTTHRFGINVFR